jgi:hypothetical protein
MLEGLDSVLPLHFRRALPGYLESHYGLHGTTMRMQRLGLSVVEETSTHLHMQAAPTHEVISR